MNSYVSLMIALLIITLWGIIISMGLMGDFTTLNFLAIISLTLLQTFFNTGLFIIAHDGMHGILYPPNGFINDSIARLALLLYAGLSYDVLREKHCLHHRFTGTNLDPDFHHHNSNFFLWYGRFMTKYVSFGHLCCLSLSVLIIVYFLQIHWFNLLIFWALPLILSSLQLFFFGTFLPHRFHGKNYHHLSSIESLHLPILLSLITCYHFSYHREHHQYPFIPWWKLPFSTSAILNELC